MVSVLVIGPKVRGFNPVRGDEFLRAIKIRTTPPFGGQVMPSAPCHKIFMLKDPTKYERDIL
jgi:hypothetical protein